MTCVVPFYCIVCRCTKPEQQYTVFIFLSEAVVPTQWIADAGTEDTIITALLRECTKRMKGSTDSGRNTRYHGALTLKYLWGLAQCIVMPPSLLVG